MPAPERNHVQVVRCKGCKCCIPISVEAIIASVTVICPVCMERRSYIVSTEVFLGQPSWKSCECFKGGGDGRKDNGSCGDSGWDNRGSQAVSWRESNLGRYRARVHECDQ
jgi:hypothetical protein